jgi:hypothetical protein
MSAAIDRASAAGALLALDLQDAGAIDSGGVAMLIAFGRTALVMPGPIRNGTRAEPFVRRTHGAGAAGLCEWPTEDI